MTRGREIDYFLASFRLVRVSTLPRHCERVVSLTLLSPSTGNRAFRFGDMSAYLKKRPSFLKRQPLVNPDDISRILKAIQKSEELIQQSKRLVEQTERLIQALQEQHTRTGPTAT